MVLSFRFPNLCRTLMSKRSHELAVSKSNVRYFQNRTSNLCRNGGLKPQNRPFLRSCCLSPLFSAGWPQLPRHWVFPRGWQSGRRGAEFWADFKKNWGRVANQQKRELRSADQFCYETFFNARSIQSEALSAADCNDLVDRCAYLSVVLGFLCPRIR